jgi:hypothetical protein
MRSLVPTAVLLLSLSLPASAQEMAMEPERGSTARRGIVDALRTPVQGRLRKPVRFEIDHIRAADGWAFVLARPLQPDGSPFDWGGTPLAACRDEGMCDDGVAALLQRVAGRWRVVDVSIGATDVPWADWDRKWGAPRGIFPFA